MEETKEDTKRDTNFLAASILVAGLMVSGSIVYLVQSRKGGEVFFPSKGGQAAVIETVDDVSLTETLERDVILGDPNAPVLLVEYGDYQCPFCGRFYTQVEPLLREEYIKTGKVKMVYRDFAFLGDESDVAAQAAECAKDQGKFWLYHDALFEAEIADGAENNGNLTSTLFLDIASRLDMDTQAFESCFGSKKYADRVFEATRVAQNLGVNATPTVFVNERKIQGAQAYEQFASVIDSFLETK